MEETKKKMSAAEVERRLRCHVAEHLGIGENEIKAESKMEPDLGADSLDRVELLMMIEEEFEDVASDELEKLMESADTTFGDLLDAVVKEFC